jgi:hypothetical protein
MRAELAAKMFEKPRAVEESWPCRDWKMVSLFFQKGMTAEVILWLSSSLPSHSAYLPSRKYTPSSRMSEQLGLKDEPIKLYVCEREFQILCPEWIQFMS